MSDQIEHGFAALDDVTVPVVPEDSSDLGNPINDPVLNYPWHYGDPDKIRIFLYLQSIEQKVQKLLDRKRKRQAQDAIRRKKLKPVPELEFIE